MKSKLNLIFNQTLNLYSNLGSDLQNVFDQNTCLIFLIEPICTYMSGKPQKKTFLVAGPLRPLSPHPLEFIGPFAYPSNFWVHIIRKEKNGLKKIRNTST